MSRFSFHRFWAIVLKEFIQMKRDRVTFAMMVGIPLMQLTLFGFAINSDPKHLPTAIRAADQGPFARTLVAALKDFRLDPGRSYAAQVHAALEASGQMFPLHLGAEGSAQIGGLIGTNAGGSQAFRYGMMQDLVLGLEVVLPDGAVWDGLRGVQKDNAGYQLRKLFCGAEGTLGVVTRAVLRLHAAPRQRVTALLALPSFEAAVEFGADIRAEAGEFVQAMEFFSETGLDLALHHVSGLTWPLESRAAAYLLLELGSGSARVPLDDIMSALLEQGIEQGRIIDGALAASEAQRAAFWRLREEQPEGQRLAGPQLKHDISVPPALIAAFVAEAAKVCEGLVPDVRINPFGHLGDGNVIGP